MNNNYDFAIMRAVVDELQDLSNTVANNRKYYSDYNNELWVKARVIVEDEIETSLRVLLTDLVNPKSIEKMSKKLEKETEPF